MCDIGTLKRTYICSGKCLNVEHVMLGPLGIDRNRGSEISNTYESDTYFALQMKACFPMRIRFHYSVIFWRS